MNQFTDFDKHDRLADAPAAAGCQALGNTTKFADTIEHYLPCDSTTYSAKTGEFFDLKVDKNQNLSLKFDSDVSLTERWLMLHTARHVLSTPIAEYEKNLLWCDKLKTYRAPYSCLKSYVLFSCLETREVKKLLSHEIGLPVVKSAINTIDGHFYTDLDSKILSNTAALNHSPIFRTVLCYRRHLPNKSLELWQSRDLSKFSFHNFTVCGSVWSCPICSAKINFYRQNQISQAYNALASESVRGSAYMYTFTISHGRSDSLDELLTMFKTALRIFKKSYNFKKFSSSSIYIGSIESLEVTFTNANGWHPHCHGLFFLKESLLKSNISSLLSDLFDAWRLACKKAGFKKLPSKKRGLDIRVALSASEYLTKFGSERNWGPEKEIASSHSKTSKNGLTPFQMLFLISQNHEQSFFYKLKFLEFSFAFKGKHQIQFSQKIISFLLSHGVDLSVTDSEIVSLFDSDFSQFHVFTDSDFETIVYNNLQSTILLLAKSDGVSAIRNLLNSYSYKNNKPFSKIDSSVFTDSYASKHQLSKVVILKS